VTLIAAASASTATTIASSATTVASTTATTVATTTAKSVSAGSLMFQMIIGLGVVLALIWFASRVLRGRVSGPGSKKRSAPLAVVGRQPLGKGVQIAIVKAGAEMYLLGVTSQQVTRLGRIKPEELDMTLAPAGDGSPDDLPPAVSAGSPGQLPVPFRLQSSIRNLQDRTLRKR
jgi:flagellar biogenesis protein FliO